MIKRVGRSYVLYSSDGQRILGAHETRNGAVAQERAIVLAKARRAGYPIPNTPSLPQRHRRVDTRTNRRTAPR